MPGPRTTLLRALRALAVASLLVSVAACGTRPGVEEGLRARPSALVKGSCWDAQQLGAALGKDFTTWVTRYAGGRADLGRAMRDDAAFTTQVDCSEPHEIELYNVVELDRGLTSRIHSYADLLDHRSSLYRRVRDAVNERCAASSPYSASEQTRRTPVQLEPALRQGSGLHVAWDPFPPDRWANGEHEFVCTFQQDRPGTIRFRDLATRRLPLSARVCLDSRGAHVPCDGPHQAEEIGEMVLNTAIDRGMVDARQALRTGPRGRYVALSTAEYARLDQVCRTLLDQVSTAPGLVARAYPGSADQWPTRDGAYLASCFALKGTGTPPPTFEGTVFDRE